MKKLAFCALAVVLCVAGVAKLSQVAAQGEQQKQSIKGTISSIAEDSKSMKLTDSTDSDKTYTMNLSKTTKVIIDSEPGKLSDLKKNDRVECICTKTEARNTYNCSEIRRNKADQK